MCYLMWYFHFLILLNIYISPFSAALEVGAQTCSSNTKHMLIKLLIHISLVSILWSVFILIFYLQNNEIC